MQMLASLIGTYVAGSCSDVDVDMAQVPELGVRGSTRTIHTGPKHEQSVVLPQSTVVPQTFLIRKLGARRAVSYALITSDETGWTWDGGIGHGTEISTIIKSLSSHDINFALHYHFGWLFVGYSTPDDS